MLAQLGINSKVAIMSLEIRCLIFSWQFDLIGVA